LKNNVGCLIRNHIIGVLHVLQEAVSWLKSADSGAAGQAFTEFLKRHGHRCIREVWLACCCWWLACSAFSIHSFCNYFSVAD